MDTLKRENPNKKARQVGRGGTRGKTAGRGTKGQKARAGNKRRPQIRDIIKKLPKLRGYRFNSRSNTNLAIINVKDLNVFTEGEVVTPESLFDKKLIRHIGGVIPKVKILGDGDLKIKLSIKNCLVSKTATEKIKKASGSVE